MLIPGVEVWHNKGLLTTKNLYKGGRVTQLEVIDTVMCINFTRRDQRVKGITIRRSSPVAFSIS